MTMHDGKIATEAVVSLLYVTRTRKFRFHTFLSLMEYTVMHRHTVITIIMPPTHIVIGKTS
jgi:hypothetical protein